MGYWGKHPLAGDSPQDEICNVISILFPEEEYQELDNLNISLFRERFIEKVPDFIERLEEMEIYCTFILPFLVAECEMRIEDIEFSQKLKSCIIDEEEEMEGGIYVENGSEYPKKENDWNGLQSPFDYARKLYDMWDDLMLGKVSFDEIPKEGIDCLAESFYEEN